MEIMRRITESHIHVCLDPSKFEKTHPDKFANQFADKLLSILSKRMIENHDCTRDSYKEVNPNEYEIEIENKIKITLTKLKSNSVIIQIIFYSEDKCPIIGCVVQDGEGYLIDYMMYETVEKYINYLKDIENKKMLSLLNDL